VGDRPAAPVGVFDGPGRRAPADAAALDRVVRDTARVLRLRDWSRIDLRMDARGVPHVIEVNPLPGVLPDPKANSCFPKAARAAGLDYAALVLAVVDAAGRRLGWTS
ncbi:MAG: D-alanine--D-alanine ligase family protein, partial [Deferrisomatales bacterium]